MKLKELIKNVENVELTPEQEKQIKNYLGIKDSKRWKPNDGDYYFYITGGGDIASTCWSMYCYIDADHFAMNNCFKTKEEAEFAAEKIKVYLELKNFADENNEPIIWDDCSTKYLIAYDHDGRELYIDDWRTSQFLGCIPFSSRELVKQAIQKVGEDRIKKYLFGVE